MHNSWLKMPISRRIGLGLLAIAVLSWSGWRLWAHTRTWCPGDVPLSLSQGSLTKTSEFRVNLAGPYNIDVEATGKSQIPLSELVCSLGLEPLWPEKTCSTKSVLRASWELTNHDKKIAEGSTESSGGGWTAEGWSQAGRTIGRFDAQKGQTLKLRVETLADASSLSATNPRLKVSMGGTAFESVLVFTGLLNVACITIGIVGIVLLLVSFRPARVKESLPSMNRW